MMASAHERTMAKSAIIVVGLNSTGWFCSEVLKLMSMQNITIGYFPLFTWAICRILLVSMGMSMTMSMAGLIDLPADDAFEQSKYETQ